MILIDIGNSFSKILINNELLTIETTRILKWLEKNSTKEIVICSVEQEVTNTIKKLYPDIVLLDNRIYDKLFTIDNPLLYKKGADRIITSYGAIDKYGENIILIDMGTCITIDVWKNKKYKSGYIYPGLGILKESLSQRVKHLPTPIDPLTYSKEIVDTSDQIFWGNIYGVIGVINQFINMEQKNYIETEFQIILTGGTIKEFELFFKKNQLNNLFNFDYKVDSKLIFYSMKKIVNEINILN